MPPVALVNRVKKSAGIAVCLLALFVASGGHWIVLQTIAWSRMIVDYARTDTLGEAVVKTFDGAHPCAMCRQISAGRENEQKRKSQFPLAKENRSMNLFCSARHVVLSPPAPARHPGIPYRAGGPDDFLEAPPTPPPRSILTAA